jgi:hypothetical protein
MSSCSYEPTKNEAEKVITQSEEFNKTFNEQIYFFLKAGPHHKNCAPPSKYVDHEWFSFENKLPVFDKLSQSGYINIDKTFIKTSGDECWYDKGEMVTVTLTEKGKNIFTQDKDDFWKAEICKKKYIGVTDIIKYTDDPSFQVTYTWKYNYNELANIVKPISFELQKLSDLNELSKGYVYLVKVNGGWGIMMGQPARRNY